MHFCITEQQQSVANCNFFFAVAQIFSGWLTYLGCATLKGVFDDFFSMLTVQNFVVFVPFLEATLSVFPQTLGKF